MAIRYPKEVHKFIQANYYGRRPEELAVLVNKKFSSGYTPAQMKSYVKNRKLPNDLPRKQIYSDVFPKEVVKYINKNYIGVGPKEMAERLNKKIRQRIYQVTAKRILQKSRSKQRIDGTIRKRTYPGKWIQAGTSTAGIRETQIQKRTQTYKLAAGWKRTRER